MNLNKIVIVWKNSPDMHEHNKSLVQLAQSILKDTEVKDHNGHEVTKEELVDADGVINIAGDGHYLNAARYLLKPEQFMAGFTLNDSTSHGHYNNIRGPVSKYIHFLERLKEGEVEQGRYQRLDVILDGESVDVVLNEVWEKSVSGSSLRHEVKINGAEGKYIHGGFGISTPSGRTGMVGRVNPLEIDLSLDPAAIIYRASRWTANYEDVVRERIKGMTGNSIYDGILPEEGSILVHSNNRPGSAHLVCDGRHELLPNPRIYDFDKDSVMEVRRSEKDLVYVY